MNRRRIIEEKGSTNVSTFVSVALSLIFLGLAGLLIANSIKSVSSAYNRALLLDQAESEIEALRLRNLELIQEEKYVTSDPYVEGEARDRMLYSKDGEVLLVLPDDTEVLGESDSTIEDSTAEEVDQEDLLKGWDRWWSVIKNGV